MPRTLSEQEFNAVKTRVLAGAPDGLDEKGFQEYVGPALDRAISDAENNIPHLTAAPANEGLTPPQPKGEGMLRTVARQGLNALPGIGAIVGGVLSTPETLGVGTIPGIALGAATGQGARDLIGHATGLDAPTSPTQKALNIGKEGAVTAASAAILPGIVSAARSPVQTAREATEQFTSAMPTWVRRLGRLVPTPAPKPPAPILERPAWQTWGEDVPPAASVEASAPASSALDPVTRANLVKQGYTPELIAQIEQRAAQSGPGIQPVASHPLTGPRNAIGAEKVGRTAGMTKTEVRQAVGSRLGEDVGTASPVLPDNAFNSVFDKLRGLPKEGPARTDYMNAARDQKAKEQIFNMIRALRNMGIIGAGAVSLPELMRSHEPSSD